MIHELIKNLGLNENETKIYLALLELGPSLVTEISKKAGINRTTCYDVLDRLIKYNLVTHASGQKAKKKYAAQSPGYLVSFLERRQKKQERLLKELKDKSPELYSLYKNQAKPAIKFFEGIDGLKSIYSETLKSKTEILSVADCEEWDSDELKDWGINYDRQRVKLKINERVLLLPTPKTVKWMASYPATTKYTRYRFLPENRFPVFNAEINIFEDKLMIAILKKPHRMGVMITSEYLANILKAMFEMAWEAAGKYGETKGG